MTPLYIWTQQSELSPHNQLSLWCVQEQLGQILLILPLTLMSLNSIKMTWASVSFDHRCPSEGDLLLCPSVTWQTCGFLEAKGSPAPSYRPSLSPGRWWWPSSPSPGGPGRRNEGEGSARLQCRWTTAGWPAARCIQSAEDTDSMTHVWKTVSPPSRPSTVLSGRERVLAFKCWLWNWSVISQTESVQFWRAWREVGPCLAAYWCFTDRWLW